MAHLDQNLLILVIVIIVVVVIAIAIFRHQFPDEDDRERHRHKLFWGLGVAILVIIVIYFVWPKYLSSETGEEHGQGSEYGYLDTFRRNREAAAAQRAAGKEAELQAKASGASKAEIAEAKKRAMQQAKWQQREVKVAGQKAQQQAEDAARARAGKP